MTKRTFRIFESTLLLMTAGVVFMSFYFQYVMGLEPCPLCLMQRWCAILLGMFMLMGLCLSTLKRARTVLAFQVFFSLAGIYFAGRQLWLQTLPPDNIPACVPGLDLMIQYFPWQEIVKVMFLGAGDCAENDWTWLGFSMPGWTLLYFSAIGFMSIVLFYFVHKTLKKFSGKN